MTLTRTRRCLSGLQAAYDARVTVRRCLAGQPTRIVDVAVLLVSELVSNALCHTEGALTVDVQVEAGAVHVAVADEDPKLPVVRRWSPLAENGRGMFLVDALATSWGVEVDPDQCGKRVWFDLHIDEHHCDN